MRSAGAYLSAVFLSAAILLPASGADTPRFAAAGLKLRGAVISAKKGIDELDAKLAALGAEIPEAEETFSAVHAWLAGEPESSIAASLGASRLSLESGLTRLSGSPRTCAGATLEAWEKAVAGHQNVHAAVREASRARLRIEQARRFDARFAGIESELRRRKMSDARIMKVASFRRDYRGRLRKAARLLDEGLSDDVLYRGDPDVAADCPRIETGEPLGAGPAALAAPPAPVREVSPSAQRALGWSADQLPGGARKGVNSNTGESLAQDKHAWDWWCLAFVATAYGRQVEELRASSAIASYKKFRSAGKLAVARENLPPGAPVFFEATARNKYYGHVALFTGRYTESGEPIIRTTGWTSWPGIHEIALSDFEKKTGAAYAGFGIVGS